MSKKHKSFVSVVLTSGMIGATGATGSDTINPNASEATSAGQELRLYIPRSDDIQQEICEKNLQNDLALFNSLRKEWFMETAFSSNGTEIILSKAHQRIIGMGKNALPFIFGVLAQKQENWFWALEAITGENPVPKEDYTNFDAAVKAWLEWGKKNGYQC